MASTHVRFAGLGVVVLAAVAQIRCVGDEPTSTPQVDAGADATTAQPDGGGGNPDGGSVAALTVIDQLVAGEAYNCVRGNGQVRCWGSNKFGQLGQNLNADFRTDVSAASTIRFPTAEKVVELAAGYETVCALFADGTVRCWGGNGNGERGAGNTVAVGRGPNDMAGLVPVDLGTRTAEHVYAGTRHFCVVTKGDGDVLCWGLGKDGARYGFLGNGRADNVGDQGGEMGQALAPVPLAEPTAELALGFTSTCARSVTGAVRCFGTARGGQLGNGNLSDETDVVDVANAPLTVASGATALFGQGPSYAVATGSGTVLTWGTNTDGRLGIGTNSNVFQPVELVSALPLTQVRSRSSHRCVIAEGGRLYCMGNGEFGRLGYGDTNERGGTDAGLATLSPLLLGVRAVATGGDHTCALRGDHDVICWGANREGQLGTGDTSPRADDGKPASELAPIPLE